MTSYPPAPLKLQNSLALDYTHSQIAYVGHEGTVFHISGPLAPMLGAQSGVVLKEVSGLDPAFKHLDNKGARQDGTTWYDTLYDPGEIDMVVELGGIDPKSTREIIAAWFGAWDPKKQGKLCWFSPERGEWYCNVRMNKPVTDRFQADWYQARGASFTWSARNDQAFWQGPPSVCSFTTDSNNLTDLFGRTSSSNLGSNYNQHNTGPGYIATPTGDGASWVTSGTTTGTAVCQEIGGGGTSIFDDQFVSVILGEDMPQPVGAANAYVDIWGRMNTNTGSPGDYGVRARIGYGTVQLSIFNNGVEHDVWNGDLVGTGVAGDVFSLQCGVNNPFQQSLEQLFLGANWTPSQYQIYQNGNPLIPGGIIGLIEDFFGLNFGYIDNVDFGEIGAGFRGYGFGMSAGGTGTGQVVPPKITLFSGGTGTGHLSLTNIGDQPAWPSYLCYGPGTFLIADGPGSSNMISFGPLLDGQIALVNTLPRLPSVIDLSPPPSPEQLDFWQTIEADVQGFIKQMINFVTNNNVPPLLQEFESLFGIVPPQGPLYSLLNGRFTNPVDPMIEQEGPVTSYIPCQIQGGSSKSKIIASLTPQRRWPE